MMIMTTWQGVITIIMAMLGTMLTRFLPFLLFPESKEPPRFITYLGTVLPYAMTGLLVVYSLKGVRLTSGSHGIPELLAIIAIALLHIWKRNMLLSIAGGSDLGLFEVNEAAEVIHGVAHPDANIIFGTVIDDEMGDEVRVTVIAAGFDAA